MGTVGACPAFVQDCTLLPVAIGHLHEMNPPRKLVETLIPVKGEVMRGHAYLTISAAPRLLDAAERRLQTSERTISREPIDTEHFGNIPLGHPFGPKEGQSEAWERYKKTFVGIQVVIGAVTIGMMVWRHLFALAAAFFNTMQMNAVLGALRANRLKNNFSGPQARSIRVEPSTGASQGSGWSDLASSRRCLCWSDSGVD